MSVSYQERIARSLTLVTALLVLLVFAIIYVVVDYTVVQSIDRELKLETDKHLGQIFLVEGEIKFAHKDEWQEQEHSQIQLNPIFIEIVDTQGLSMDRSPNLGENHLSFYPDRAHQDEAWTLKTGSREVRQMQIPLKHEGRDEGYMLVAKSFEDARDLLTNLRNILLILYPGILISLFLSMRFLAGKSIQPIKNIIAKTNQISQSNLNERVPEVEPDDEIAQLTRSINGLLARLEQALIREKQFTSDASHELRTPLAVMKGTLEVLIRKPRTGQEYEEKIRMTLGSIDRMSAMIDQLLSLARVGNNGRASIDEVELLSFTRDIVARHKGESGREVSLQTNLSKPLFVRVNEGSLQMIFNNLLQNALKYSAGDSPINLKLGIHDALPFVQVEDQGSGISYEALEKIFDPFYRDVAANPGVSGTGLGLAIVRKLANESHIQVAVESETGKGSVFRLIFEKKI